MAQVAFLPSSLVLANDGKGTDVLKDFAQAAYLILPDTEAGKASSESGQIIMHSQVLGEETQANQMFFYDENVNVLGSETQISPIPTPASTTSLKDQPSYQLLDLLSKIDQMILDFWEKITGIVLD
ncbi:MAG: hypothetical protein M1607_01040 [Patescibacteria group bacterium]|nr:hypothetical protein [Patescibacteria group bacterium]